MFSATIDQPTASLSNVKGPTEKASKTVDDISGGASEVVGDAKETLVRSEDGGGVVDVGASIATGTGAGEGSGLGTGRGRRAVD